MDGKGLLVGGRVDEFLVSVEGMPDGIRSLDIRRVS